MKRTKKDDVTNQITLYRVKDGSSFDTANFKDYDLVLTKEMKLPNESYKVFFRVPSQYPVKWFGVFKNEKPSLRRFEGQPPMTMNSGFIFLVKYNSSVYAFTGGLGFHALQKEYQIEARFGIEIAKRVLTQDNLRGLVQKDSGGFLNSLDRAFKSGYHPMSDIDNMHRVLTNLRASRRKGESAIKDSDYDIGLSVKAGDSLSVTGQKNLKQMLGFVRKADEIWNRPPNDNLKIPELEYINPKTEKSITTDLVSEISSLILNTPNTDALYIDDMEIGLISDRIDKYSLIYKKKVNECSSVSEVFAKASELMKNSGASLEDLRIAFSSIDDTPTPPEKRLVHYICGDVELNGKIYFIINSRWYRANVDYITKIDEHLNEIPCFSMNDLSLPKWSNSGDEDDYNYNKTSNSHTILHKHLIHPTSGYDKLELCDLLYESKDYAYWIHVKNASGAALRDLFSQGYVSAQLYQGDNDFRVKVWNAEMDRTECHNLTADDLKRLKALEGKSLNRIIVIYAIYDDKHTIVRPTGSGIPKTSDYLKGTLSLYAKIDLLRRNQDIRALGFNVGIVRIEK